jgi:phthiocerol/phenolphthiocerol synthesis type-I polyketide synthase E
MSEMDTNGSGDVAIIGMACRFPGAANAGQFWQNIRGGVESVSFFTDDELMHSGVARDVLRNPSYVKAKAILDGIEMFDAPFFGMTPRETEITDPQQRVFLECAFEALENAGYDAEAYEGLIGVYAGMGREGYAQNLYAVAGVTQSVGDLRFHIGNDKNHLATFASYKLNLRGPSLSIQTACSTSLVAVHLACQSLVGGECDIALAGGVSIDIPQKSGYFYQEGGILSVDGHCRSFDERASGTVGGSGVGLVVLKRMADALADGDLIQAVIKGSAVNNDGSSKVGYTAPSIDGQAKVIAEAQFIAGIPAETITYIEAHGTATQLGDPVEIAALTQVFRKETAKKNFCAIGSVKANIGHLDTAAGVAGIIKTVLALKHGYLTPSLHFEKPNPRIDFENSPFYVNTKLSEWKSNGTPRRAGVSSFGMGGTNVHIIVEEAPQLPVSGPSQPCQLIVLSAKTETALKAAAKNLVADLKDWPAANLADVAYTLQVGRRALSHRLALVGRGHDDVARALEQTNGRVMVDRHDPRYRPVVFMFPGQGAQYVNMARELYEAEPSFRATADECLRLLKPHLGFELRDVLYPVDNSDEATQSLNQTGAAQPALFVIEYALAKLWMSWGVQPDAMMGHSIGEYVAACLSGVFSLSDALALVATRGRLMQSLPAGAMLAVALPENEVLPLLDHELSLAVVNGSSQCVISGTTQAVSKLESRLAEEKIDCQRLRTSHAFHSTMMEPILEEFTKTAAKIQLNPPQVPFISNVTGTWIQATDATDPHYWATHLRNTVRFAGGIAELSKESERLYLEVGPSRTLTALVGNAIASLGRQRDGRSDLERLLEAAGRLWVAGARIDWKRMYDGQTRHRVPLSTYPFDRKRYWIEPEATIPESPPAGNGSASIVEMVSDDETEIEQILEQQLQVMRQQLDLLSNS